MQAQLFTLKFIYFFLDIYIYEILKASKTYQEELECAKKRLNELEQLSKQRDETLEKYKIEIKSANQMTEKHNEERQPKYKFFISTFTYFSQTEYYKLFLD